MPTLDFIMKTLTKVKEKASERKNEIGKYFYVRYKSTHIRCGILSIMYFHFHRRYHCRRCRRRDGGSVGSVIIVCYISDYCLCTKTCGNLLRHGSLVEFSDDDFTRNCVNTYKQNE